MHPNRRRAAKVRWEDMRHAKKWNDHMQLLWK